jgi:hypothetical protein
MPMTVDPHTSVLQEPTMSNPPTGADPRYVPDAPARPGMSPAVKIVLILLGIFGLLFVLCCGGFVYVGYKVGSAIKEMENMFSDDPVVVVQVAARIAEIDIPEGLAPSGSADMELPFFGRVGAFVMYEDQETDSSLVLFVIGDSLGADVQTQFRMEIDRALEEAGVEQEEGAENIEIEQPYDKEFTIRGQPATFRYQKGTDKETGKRRIIVTGQFRSDDGPTTVIFTGDLDKYSEEQIDQMIESIK